MIQMKSGVYGAKNGMIRPEDGPFSLSEQEEARLVARGVARYVATEGTTEPPVAPQLPELPEGVVPIPEYHTGMTAKELREIGKLCGLTFKVGMSKEEMVSTLDAHIAENTVDPDEAEPEDTEEVVPEEEAPVFDAAEAVQ